MGRKISEIMTKRLETLEAESTLADASVRMKEKNIRHLLIVDRASGALLGMVSDRDVKKILSPFLGSARATAQDNATASIAVGKIMVPKEKIVSAKGDDEIKAVVEKMLVKKYGSIPIVDDKGRAIGIVTRGDLLKLLISFL